MPSSVPCSWRRWTTSPTWTTRMGALPKREESSPVARESPQMRWRGAWRVSFEVRWLPRSQRDLKKLDPPVRRRVFDAVKQFALDGTGDVVRLEECPSP